MNDRPHDYKPMGLRQRNSKVITVDTKKSARSEILKLLPGKIYKYYSINEYTFNVLENNSLWFSSPYRFNDPFDCKINVNFGKTKKEIIENLTNFFSEMLVDDETKEKFENFARKTKRFNKLFNTMLHYAFDERVGVCCFSEIPNSALMWAHYGNSHTGLCLIFENRRKNFIRNNLLPVQYLKEYPKFNLSEININDFQSFLLHVISSKCHDWDYEFEWRAIIETGGNKSYAFQKNILKGIIFGINTTTEHKNEIKKIIRKKKYDDIKYYQAEIGKNDYLIKLRKEKLS